MKLTDSQLVILSSAAKHDGGAVLPLPKSIKLNKGAVTIVLKSLLKHNLVEERGAAPDEACWRETGDQRFALIIAEPGLKALGIEARDGVGQITRTGADDRAAGGEDMKKPTPKKNFGAREGSKLSVLVGLLSRKTGATIEEAATATGWQHHSIRGAISGSLKKKMGLTIISSANGDRGRVYRIGEQ